jgi:hypothetical protein
VNGLTLLAIGSTCGAPERKAALRAALVAHIAREILRGLSSFATPPVLHMHYGLRLR